MNETTIKTAVNTKIDLTDKDIQRSAMRWFFSNTSAWNWERMQHSAFAWSIYPCLKKIYHNDPDKLNEAMLRHMKFFNTEPTVGGPLILGTVLAMEKSRAEGEDVPVDVIDAIKTGLMGPMAAIGDSLFASTLNALLLSIAMGMAIKGNVFGPFLFAVIWIILNVFIVLKGSKAGFNQGTNLVESDLFSPKFMGKITLFFTILGIVVVGGLSASFINTGLITGIHWGDVAKPTTLKSVLDGLMPKILPFLVVLGMWYLHAKKNVSVMKLLLITLVSCAVITVLISLLS